MLLFDDQGRVLLLRGHDPSHPQRQWWFTPGGGVDPGESTRQAAARELREETGFVVHTGDLVGPVWERTAFFDFRDRPYVQQEEFFMADDASAVEQVDLAWTAAEDDTIDQARWMTPQEIAEADIDVFPTTLAELLTRLRPWDGSVLHLGSEHA